MDKKLTIRQLFAISSFLLVWVVALPWGSEFVLLPMWARIGVATCVTAFLGFVAWLAMEDL